MTVDLHLLTQVLCCQVTDRPTEDGKREDSAAALLCSVHNGVYFAVSVLHQCQVW